MASKEKKQPEKTDDSIFKEFVRQFKARPFIFTGTFVVLVIVVVAFVFVPAIVPSQGRVIDLNFGSYNKIPISYVEGNYFYQVQQNLARQSQSGDLDAANYQITLYRIWREAFEAAVVHTAILDEMNRAGYSAPSSVVDRTVAMMPDFQDNGVFSSAKYRSMDSNRRMALWRQIRDSITAQYYISDVTWLKTPSKEGDFIASMSSPQRSFDMVSFPVNSYPDSEISEYVRNNPSLFRITHLSKITITSSEREARQVLASIQNGNETFEDAARNKSRDYYAENAGDMGNRMVFELLLEIPNESDREHVLGLSRGSFSNVIKYADGAWVFFRAEDNVREADSGDPVIMDRIRNYIMTYERGRAEDWARDEAEKFCADARQNDFDSAVNDRVMAKQSFGPVPLNYGDIVLFPSLQSSGISELNYAGQNERFIQACFVTPVGVPSDPVVVGSNVVVVCPLEEIIPDEEETGFISMYYSYWLTQSFEQDLREYFLYNGKLDDRFWDIFQYFLE